MNNWCTSFEVKSGFEKWIMLESYCGGRKVTLRSLKPEDIWGFRNKSSEYMAIKLKKDKDNDTEYSVMRKYILPIIHLLG